ncbi:MAG: ABC transporter substrate-binding protein [Bacteroidales bacterium]|nr:ABC transporter substrate-binding protein [Bacteroidales bacterium]
MNKISLWLFFGFTIAGCTSRAPEDHRLSGSSVPGDTIMVKYADGFRLKRQENAMLITVSNPWQNASGIQYNYVLSDTFSKSVIVDDFTCHIKTPVSNVVCLSTTHLGFIVFLNEITSVSGISGKNYVVDEMLRSRISQHLITDVGYDENLNYELLLKIKPDVVFAYGVGIGITNTIRKLSELGIPVVLIGEYLEEEPLAKTEWVKVFAAFYDKEEETSAGFDSVANRYLHLTDLAANVENNPGVVLGLPWRGTWYISGSRSYVARMIKDAGGKYIMDHLDFNESRPMSLEEVYKQALSADYWLNPGDAVSKTAILSVDERFGKLPSFEEDRVFNNNNILNSSGGNAFYESGVVEPDIILSDLIYILHPQLLPSHRLKYYKKLR